MGKNSEHSLLHQDAVRYGLTFLFSFGFKDGISQPKIEGLDDPPKDKEPKAVKPG